MKNRERVWFGIFVILVFIAGISTGLLLHEYIESRSPVFEGRRPPMRPMHLTALMRERLNLSDEQQRAIDEVLDKRRASMDDVHLEMRERVRTDIAALDAEINSILTPDQRIEFEKVMQEFRDRMPFPLPTPDFDRPFPRRR